MAKSMLLNVLVDVLGQYVEGLTKENLKLGVFSGKIEFLNLKLKDSALDQLNLPIQVKKGSLKRVSVKVPWTSLESKPVEVLIDGLYLLASPLDLSQNTPEEGRKMNLAMRAKKIKQVDDAVMLSIHQSKDLQSSAKRASYVQQLVTSIVDNLEVQVTNVHIRYEDSISEPGKTFCCGITLDKIILTATDDQWNIRFVKRDAANKAATAIHKLGTINNVGLYWNISDRPQSSMSSEEWEQVMQKMIYREENRDIESIRQLDFILSPPNQLVLKLTHREVCSEVQPNVDLVIETTQINAKLDRQQFRQLMVMNRSFGELDRKRLICLYRPMKRATEDPRAWWHYAYRLVTGRDLGTANKFHMLMLCTRSRGTYIAAVKKWKVDSYFLKEGAAPLTLPPEITSIEEVLPLPTILLFREEALKAAAVEIRKILDAEATAVVPASSTISSMFSSTPTTSSAATSATKAAPTTEKKSYFSGWFSSSKPTPPPPPVQTQSTSAAPVLIKKVHDQTPDSPEDQEDAKLMDDLELQLEKLNTASQAAINQKFSFRGRLHSSANIVVTYDNMPMVTIRAGMGLLIETRYSNVLLNFSLHNFSVEDQITKDPFDNMLIVMAERHIAEALNTQEMTEIEQANRVPFSFVLELKPDLVRLKFAALPVIITWNKDCIKHFINFITSATSDDSKANINPLLKASLEQFSAEAALPKVETEIVIDIDAPKIIMPEGVGKCNCFTVLDTGYLSMRGKLNMTGMDFNIALRNVNISMPDRSLGQSTSEYLITPFNFLINLRSKDEVDPVVYVDMTLEPRISANLDAIKLVRLIQVILVILESVDTSSLSESEELLDEVPILISGSEKDAVDHELSRLRRVDVLETDAVTNKKRPVNFESLKVRCTFNLSELTLELRIAESHDIKLIIDGVYLQVLQRAGDSSIVVDVNSLVISDSLRTEDHPYILVARPDENSSSDKLLKVTYRTISSKLSPYYRGNSSEIIIDISRVSLFIDALTLKSYTPLMADFMEAWMQRIEIPKATAAAAISTITTSDRLSPKRKSLDGTPMKRKSEALIPPSASKVTVTAVEAKTTAPTLGGLYLEFALEAVGLYLLQPRFQKVPAHLMMLGEEKVEYFESSFLFNVSNLEVNITADVKTKVKATLSTVDLIDMRKSSEKMVFKKVLRTGKMFDSDDMDEDPTVKLHEHLLYVTFEQNEKGASTVDVTVRNLSTIVAMDVVMDLVAVIMDDVEVIMALIATMQPSDNSNESRRLAALTKSGIDEAEDIPIVKPAGKKGDILISVSVINPRLILLEDPMSANSKAIQTRCGIFLRYVIHNVEGESEEQRGSFHTSVRDIESFAILDLSKQTAVHRIIEPLGIEVHFNNRVVADKLLTMQVTVTIVDIFLRVSLNDIVLVQNIFQRVGESAKKNALLSKEVAMETQEQHLMKTQKEPQSLTVYGFRFSIDQLNVMLINDYNGQNAPLIRFDALHTDFSANGALVGLEGDGSIILLAEYYNSQLGCWEPVMEKWKPLIGIKRDVTGTIISVSHNRLLQLNVTGELLKCIVGAVSLVSRIGKEGSYKSRKDTVPLSFRNELGVPVEIVDHKSKQIMASLTDEVICDSPKDVLKLDVDAGFDLSAIPEVDVYLGGEYTDIYAPLQRLSTRSRKPKVFHLHTISEEVAAFGSSAQIMAPVSEEVYQYSRYNFVKNCWEQPWSKVGDPHEWADVLGKGNKNPKTFQLPHSWEWVDKDWKVDMSGIVGKEIDKDGWEYATSFPAFTLTNPKHTKQPTDCVRRRRWIRRRAIHQTMEVNVSRSLASNLVWEVVTNADETKTILLKSTKVIKNELSVPIEITFDTLSQSIMVLAPRTSCSLPLRHVGNQYFQMRPQGGNYSWSPYIPFVSEGSQRPDSLIRSKCDDHRQRAFWFGYYLHGRDNINNVILHPIMEVYNFLPCPLQCSFSSDDGLSDSIAMEAGASSPVTACGIRDLIPTVFSIGPYSGAEAFPLPPRDDHVLKRIMLYDSSGNNSLTISVKLKMNTAGVLSMVVYTSLLFVDKSGLGFGLGVQSAKPVQRNKTGDFSYSVSRLISPHVEENLEHGSLSWAIGAGGLTLFEPGDNKFVLSTANGLASLKNLSLESFGATKSNHEVFNSESNSFHHIAVKCEPYPLAADLSQVLTVMPSYHVVNCLSESLVLRQKDAKEDQVTFVGPRTSQPWHSPGSSVEFNVYFRTETHDWSIGLVNINEIGTSTLLLPRQGACDVNQNNFKAINCEVRFSDPDDPSYITIVIWESTIRRNQKARKFIFDTAVNLSVKNETAIPLIVRQAGINVGNRLRDQHRRYTEEEIAKFEALVSPGEWLPYGWTDQDVGNMLEISVPSALSNNVGKPVVINMMKIGTEATLDLSPIIGSREVLTIKVKTHANGRALIISGGVPAHEKRRTTIQEYEATMSTANVVANDTSLQLNLQTVSISVIADKPTRRELFCIYLEKISVFMQHVARTPYQDEASLLEFKLQDMQIDNFSETAVYPVLLTSVSTQERKERKAKDRQQGSSSDPVSSDSGSVASREVEYLNFMEFSCFRDVPEDQKTGVLRSIAFRLLELKVTVDSASILLYITDLHSDILEKATSRNVADKLALTVDAQEFNDKIFAFVQSDRIRNVEWQYTLSQQSKFFIEQLTIHPMRASLSFYPNRFPRSMKAIHPSLRWMRSLENVTSVEDFELRINSYIATNVLEPLPRLMESIGTKIEREIRSNLVKIAGSLVGSMSLLGKPAGLYKKIGSGVEDFFYEPYQGLMESPTGFVTGIGKGTTRLITGVASGVVGSATNIVGSASGGVASVARGVARVSGNEAFVKRSEERRREMKASGGGVMAGLKAGGESVVSGFSTGFSGLVTKPFEEGRKSGAMGFLKGVGQGIIGVAVNPVMGVTEGISSVAQGLNRSFNSDVGSVHVRPKRAFARLDPDVPDELVLSTLNIFQADAQNFVEKRASAKNYTDTFICATTLGFSASSRGEEDPLGLVLSRQFLFLLGPAQRMLWTVQISLISHLELIRLSNASGDSKYVLRIVEYDSAGLMPRQVFCADKRAAADAYDVFVHFRKYFGNPNRMEPSEAILGTMENASKTSSSTGAGAPPSVSSASLSASDSTGSSPMVSPTISSSQDVSSLPQPPSMKRTTSNVAGGSAMSSPVGTVPEYNFGAANSNLRVDYERLNEKQILAKASEALLKRCWLSLPVPRGEERQRYHRAIDETVWRFVSDWNQNHDMLLNPSRCCVAVFINHARSPVQITHTELREGADLWVLGVGDGYDTAGRVIRPGGGAAVVFAKGHRPSLVSKEHVKFTVTTTAFVATVATRENRAECMAQSGYSAAFLEKSRTDWWAKYVIVVN